VVCKGVRFRLGRSWGISRISNVLFLWDLRCDDGAGWSASFKNWVVVNLVVYRVDDISLLGGRCDICVNACVAWWLWLAICERVMRLFE